MKPRKNHNMIFILIQYKAILSNSKGENIKLWLKDAMAIVIVNFRINFYIISEEYKFSDCNLLTNIFNEQD